MYGNVSLKLIKRVPVGNAAAIRFSGLGGVNPPPAAMRPSLGGLPPPSSNWPKGGLTPSSSNSFFRVRGGLTPPSSNSFPSVHCSGTCLSRISKSCFPRKQKPLLGTLIRDGQLFPGRVFPRKQKPVLGTLIRDAQLFPGRVFPREQKPMLGTLIRDG